jgi:streptomycin 6-kinase
MNETFGPNGDLAAEQLLAEMLAKEWKLSLEAPFEMSNVSYVAPTTDGAVLKVAWLGDDESLHEAEALELWAGNGAVRLLRRMGRVLLEERAIPGDDLSLLPEDQALDIAIRVALKLWLPATAPFRPVGPEVSKWLDRAQSAGSVLLPMARELFEEIGGGADWLVHGDFHHHNILRSGHEFVAIDPKPFLADREYDVAAYLWNPMGNQLVDPDQTERRIQSFVAAGLDEYRIRAWTVIRGSYLRSQPDYVGWLRSLLA